MHRSSEPEWISAWEIDYNCVDVEKKEENGEQKILLKGVESEENDMLQL
jgi:hypothetical protein